MDENTFAADDDPWYSALSAAFKKHNLEVLMMVIMVMVIMGIVVMVMMMVMVIMVMILNLQAF